MNCILLSAFIGQYTIHKKTYKMSNIKFMDESIYTTVLVLHLWHIRGNQCGDVCVTSLYDKNRNRTLCYFNFPYVYVLQVEPQVLHPATQTVLKPQPHQIANTQRTENKTTYVVIQQHSCKLLMMDILMSETCCIHKKWNEIASDIKLVFYFSSIFLLWNIRK